MCGIWGYISKANKEDVMSLFKSFHSIIHRGPDRSDFKIINNNIYLGFHRLAIMDKSALGDQPFVTTLKQDNRSIYTMCNGEIYNYKSIADKYDFTYDLETNSDCEILKHLYTKIGFDKLIRELRGEFAIAVLDINNDDNSCQLYLGRDHIGVRPLFLGADDNGIGFSSELKGLIDIIEPSKITQIEGGTFVNLGIKNNKVTVKGEYYYTMDKIKTIHTDLKESLDIVKKQLIDAVECRMISDRPMGALLSGGLDSSLVVSIASNYLKKNNLPQLKTFSIGIPGSTDKKYAEMVSKHCGTIHTHVEFTNKEFLDAIESIVNVTETYDITTIRASTGQYLISKWIKENTDIKVLLIGDGSDELCSGYMYFHKAPSPLDSHNENIRLLKDLIYYDVLRADRGIASNGLEARVPYLDHNFVNTYLAIDPAFRVPKQKEKNIEKWLLRKSFDDNEIWLPNEVLWRKKEAFSDGVSSKARSWYEIIQENVESLYTEDELKEENINMNGMKVKIHTKEALHYRRIYNRLFHKEANCNVPYYWMPKWSGNIDDPSARVLDIYE